MSTLLITVIGPQKSIDLQVPGELPISDLLPLLLEVCCTPAETASTFDNTSWQVLFGNILLPQDRVSLYSWSYKQEEAWFCRNPPSRKCRRSKRCLLSCLFARCCLVRKHSFAETSAIFVLTPVNRLSPSRSTLVESIVLHLNVGSIDSEILQNHGLNDTAHCSI